jgi:hypothetical protein
MFIKQPRHSQPPHTSTSLSTGSFFRSTARRKTFYENILLLTNINNSIIIPLLRIIFYLWILYTLDVKGNLLPNSSFHVIAN